MVSGTDPVPFVSGGPLKAKAVSSDYTHGHEPAKPIRQ